MDVQQALVFPLDNVSMGESLTRKVRVNEGEFFGLLLNDFHKEIHVGPNNPVSQAVYIFKHHFTKMC